MQQYIQNLIVNIEPLIKPITSYCSGATKQHIRIPLEDVNPMLLAFLNTHNVGIRLVELFYIPPKAQCGIHVDYVPDGQSGDYVKLNWQTGGKDSVMRWYEQKDKLITKEYSLSKIGSKYMEYAVDEVNCIYTAAVGYPSIVQVCVPHNIVNFDEPRYVLSIVPRHFTSDGELGRAVSMVDAIEIFRNFTV